MRIRCSVILPVIGLILFGGVSYDSLRVNRDGVRARGRYFWWSSIRLDSDPLSRHPRVPEPCPNDAENCISFDPQFIWIDPGWLTKSLILSALPAFVVAQFVISGFGRLGISQISSFMILTPLLILAWYYFVGRLLDRWRYRRPNKS